MRRRENLRRTRQIPHQKNTFAFLRNVLAGLALLCLARPVLALDETVVFDRMIDIYAQDISCDSGSTTPAWERGVVVNPNDGYRARYSRFGCTVGPRGSILLLPGRGEGSFEYYETAMDFIDRGFGPIYVLDHRGQGLSPRLLADPHKGHVERFEDYVDDAMEFVDVVRADLADLRAGPEPALYLTSNSMGGAIGIGMFQRYGADNPFRAAAFLGSMIDVNYHSFTGTSASWLNLRLYSETGALLQAHWRCGVATFWNAGRCEDYAVPGTSPGYQPGVRQFLADTQAMMTHSKARYDLRTHMMDSFDWSAMADQGYAATELWPGPQLGAATNGWVREAAQFNRQMRKAGNLQQMTHVPVMLLTGTEDLRAYHPYAEWRGKAPDLSRHTGFCDDLNAESLAATGEYVCEFVAIDGGYHELFKERDAERQRALDAIDWFFRT